MSKFEKWLNHEAYIPPPDQQIRNFRWFGWVDEMRQRIAELEFELEEANEK